MSNFLEPIKTVRKVQTNLEQLESLSLNEGAKPKAPALDISPSVTNDEAGPDSDTRSFLIISSQNSTSSSLNQHRRHDSTAFLQRSYLQNRSPASLPDDAREILKSQPDREDLVAILQYLQYGIDGRHDFNVHVAGPKASQIIHALVTVTIPEQWVLLRKSELSKSDLQLKRYVESCLSSVAGIGALLMQIRLLAAGATEQQLPIVEDCISILGSVLVGNHILSRFLADARRLYRSDAQRRTHWQEVTALLAGSRILTTLAQVFATLKNLNPETNENAWLGDGAAYSGWLAKNISVAALNSDRTETESWTMLGQILKRALSLGYRDTFVAQLYPSLIMGNRASWTSLQQLLQNLSPHEQRSFLDAVLRDTVRQYLHNHSYPDEGSAALSDKARTIGAVAAMIDGIVHSNPVLEDHVMEWLTSATGEYASLGLDARRAVIATLALRADKLRHVLGKCLESFGNKAEMQHDPMLQQEATAQTILIVIGYLDRSSRDIVKQVSTSSTFLRAVSTRLAASIPQARFLGMVVAAAVSRLVDQPGKVLDFGIEEMEDEEAQRWLKLVHVEDKVGRIDDLLLLSQQPPDFVQRTTRRQIKATRGPERPQSQVRIQNSKIISIEEVEETSEDEADLVPYPKPDDDPSDSEDDPTLITRSSKPTAPVYIIDLIRQLQADDKPDAVDLALKTAPGLIRRKAHFGHELSDNAVAVVSALINVQESMSKRESQQIRLEGLIASLVSTPARIGPWIASMYFEGDFSIAQRSSLLTTVGLAARELAGYKDDPLQDRDESLPAFPSKRLPPHLAAIYNPIDAAARQIERSTLRPLALEAADKMTGPDILKVRTFSSRMEVEKKAAQKSKERSQRIPKNLHKLLADSLYLPLCCRMSLVLSSHTNLSSTTLFEPHLMRLFLQTLTVVVSTLGPHAVQLPTVTRETLILLTSLHTSATRLAHDPVVLPALLQLLLTTLDLNIEAGPVAEEHLVTDFGAMVAELVTWASNIANLVSVPVVSGDGMEGMPWTILVAGIQVKWHEVGKKFQGRMLGLMGDDMI